MNTYKHLKVLQGHYGYHGWEDITDVLGSNRADVLEQRQDLLAYRENAPEYAYRIITRRELISQEKTQ